MVRQTGFQGFLSFYKKGGMRRDWGRVSSSLNTVKDNKNDLGKIKEKGGYSAGIKTGKNEALEGGQENAIN